MNELKANLSLLGPSHANAIASMSAAKLAQAEQCRSSDPKQALIYTLQGCLATTRRYGFTWVYNLHELLDSFRPILLNLNDATESIILMLDNPGVATEPVVYLTPLNPKYLWVFFIGLAHELLVQARKAYGVDAAYAIALEKVQMQWRKDHAMKFKVAQVEMLKWAKVHEKMGLVISDVGGGMLG